MRRVLLPVLMGLTLLLLTSAEGWSLPPCPGSPLSGSVTSNFAWWSNCEGTFIFGNESKYAGFVYVSEYKYGQGNYIRADGSKYVGQWRYDRQNGQVTLTYLDGRVQECVFVNVKFLYARKTPSGDIAMRHNHNRLGEIKIEVLG